MSKVQRPKSKVNAVSQFGLATLDFGPPWGRRFHVERTKCRIRPVSRETPIFAETNFGYARSTWNWDGSVDPAIWGKTGYAGCGSLLRGGGMNLRGGGTNAGRVSLEQRGQLWVAHEQS